MSDSTDSTRSRSLEAVAVEVAAAAAAYVRSRSGAAVTAATKSSPTDVVTHTDLETERLIRSELLGRCPGSSILGEEFAEEDGGNNVGWIVDPIDGTVNFLYDLPVVAVSIAATIDAQVVAGAVADVHRGEMFSAARGAGAKRAGHPVHAAALVDLGQALVATGFAYEAEQRAAQAATLHRVLPSCRDIRCMGSAALNLCWVGCGRLDAYFERGLKPYDYAAGALVAAEGGAVVELPDAAGLTFAAGAGIAGDLRALLSTP